MDYVACPALCLHPLTSNQSPVPPCFLRLRLLSTTLPLAASSLSFLPAPQKRAPAEEISHFLLYVTRGMVPSEPQAGPGSLPKAPGPCPAHLLKDSGSGGQSGAVLGKASLGSQRDLPQGEVDKWVYLGRETHPPHSLTRSAPRALVS